MEQLQNTTLGKVPRKMIGRHGGHTCDASTWDAEAVRLPQIQGFVCNSKFQGRQSCLLQSYLKHLTSTPSINFKFFCLFVWFVLRQGLPM